ncbi:protein containing DNA/RNA helicase, partial [mine drainage metagenome]
FLDVMQSGRDSGYYQAVTATSIVGHGVDLDSLNMMVFRGMPHSISEYIQAMSRVGRNDGVPALVVNVYNPNRERDSSHFEAHQKYLELRELLLRNIPTTRFSRQALEKTLPGLLLHHV